MKIKLLFLLLFLNSIFFTCAQNRDSIFKVIANSKSEKEIAKNYLKIAHSFNWNKPDSMALYAEKALALAEKNKFDSLIYLALNTLASSHYVTAKYSKGIEVGLRAYRISKQKNNSEWEADISNLLGILYLNSEKYDNAIPFIETSINFHKKSAHRKNLASALNNLANAYLLKNEIKKSLVYRYEAIALRKEINNPSALADSYNDMGETYMKLNLPDSALIYYTEAYKIKQLVNDIEMMALTSLNIARIYRQKKDYKKALLFLEKSERWSVEINSKQYLFELYKEMSFCYKSLGKTDEAYTYLEKHIQFKDSVINIASRRQMNELTEQFQSEKKSLEIKSLKKERQKNEELANEKDKRKNTVLFFSLFILLAIGIYTVVLFKRFKLTSAQKIIIETQKELVDKAFEKLAEKNKEVIDSIHYAKRIQTALLTTEWYIEKTLKRLLNKK